ncbi:dnd system-associated protein 4 [[Phormidium ambiguum] IAM M-71]|uniref:Dnd system-associated protein 4 n=1 Tax=[Phormidium ambiguum] IAM M-71 TaxID=454136 RepID=A0A1U7IIA7_9CYAN|nr:DNA phosphorothioation-associated protein 4 [Phormidium ambiguum]OKH36817.1 dnd system-associated protein 4 [Phormidium ambiguum IAM M-71]
MGANRVRVGKDKADLVKALTLGNDTTGPFQTYADAIAFAAALGAKRKKRVVLQEVSKKEPGAIAQEIFISRGYDRLIKLLAISETKDINIISPNDAEAEETRIAIFEEYANGGLEILQEELRGAVDYTERLLLMMIAERDRENQPEGEFNLSRFL